MHWLIISSLAAASEVPDTPPLRHTNSAFGLGLTHLAVASSDPGGHTGGLLLDYRGEVPITASLQLNLMLSAGITRPQNTLAMLQWGVRHGEWTTHAFVDVTEWAGRGIEETRVFRYMGAFSAYTFLVLSYAVVPVVWALSPFAAVGHVLAGPTVSWHSDAVAPNGFVELGVGGALYGHPMAHVPQAGMGPMAGVGMQAGKQTVGLRVLVSPPGLHSDGVSWRETMVATSFVVTL